MLAELEALHRLSQGLQESCNVRESFLHFCSLLQSCSHQQTTFQDAIEAKMRFSDCFHLFIEENTLTALWSEALHDHIDASTLFFRCYRSLCNFVADEVKIPTFDNVTERFLRALFLFLDNDITDEKLRPLACFVQLWDANLQARFLPQLAHSKVAAQFVQQADAEWSLSALCLLLRNDSSNISLILLCVSLLQQSLQQLDIDFVAEQSILRFTVSRPLAVEMLRAIPSQHYPKLLSRVLIILSDRNAVAHKRITLLESLSSIAVLALTPLSRQALSATLPDLGTSLEVLITLAVSTFLDNSHAKIRRCGMKIGKSYADKCGYDLNFDELSNCEDNIANDEAIGPVPDGSSVHKNEVADADSGSDSELEGYDVKDSNVAFSELKSVPEIQTNYLSVCLQLLNCPENDQYAKAKQLAGLRRISIIMENDPADAVDYCYTLVESILNLSNMYSVEDFDQLRSQAILSILLKSPTQVLEVMQKCLYSKDVGLGLKLFCLSILQKAAQSLSSQASSPKQEEAEMAIPANTIIKRPKKLEQLHSSRVTYRNNFLPICDNCFQIVKSCLDRESMTNVESRSEEYNLIRVVVTSPNTFHKSDLAKEKTETKSDFDLMLTTNCLVTLTVFVRNMQSSLHHIEKYSSQLIKLCSPHLRSSSVELRKSALLGSYFSIESLLKAIDLSNTHSSSSRRSGSALELLQNISMLQSLALEDESEKVGGEMLSDPAVVDHLDAIIELYSQEHDDVCRDIIAKTVNLYKSHM